VPRTSEAVIAARIKARAAIVAATCISHDLPRVPWRACSIRRAWGLHLKRRAFARRRLRPDATAVHLHDLLGEAEARATLGLGKRTVDLMELLEDPALLIKRYAGTGVCYRHGETAIPRARRDAHLAGVGELDGVPSEIEQHLRCSSPRLCALTS